MDSSSSATTSSSNSQYTGAVFPASTTGRPRWPDLTIYDSTPHYPPPPMENNNNSRLLANPSPSYSTSAYEYGTYNYAGSTAEKQEEEGAGGGERSEFVAVEREHMFDKVVTPSDVGKLNRLVIPKQHAEKYFPLDSNSGDSKGLLLNFEDRTGKSWRFRYSYWNSSQSYVMTKGWSRFVKEKKLDAGDIVSFHRGVGDSAAKSSFYIDWRRRPDAPPPHHYPLYPRGGGVGMQFPHPHHPAVDASQFQHGFGFHRPINHAHPYYLSHPIIPPPLGLHQAQAQARFLNLQRGSVVSYNGVTNNNYNSSTTGPGGGYGPNFCTPQQTGSVVYLGAPHQQMQMAVPGSGGSSSRREEAMVFDSVPVVHGGKAAAAASSSSSSSKRLRLFGVNMDCTEPQDECDVTEHINRHHHQQNQHDLVLDSDRISSSSSDSALQLRLHGSGVSAASPSTASDFVDKGKSSMSLDLDLDLDM